MKVALVKVPVFSRTVQQVSQPLRIDSEAFRDKEIEIKGPDASSARGTGSIRARLEPVSEAWSSELGRLMWHRSWPAEKTVRPSIAVGRYILLLSCEQARSVILWMARSLFGAVRTAEIFACWLPQCLAVQRETCQPLMTCHISSSRMTHESAGRTWRSKNPSLLSSSKLLAPWKASLLPRRQGCLDFVHLLPSNRVRQQEEATVSWLKRVKGRCDRGCRRAAVPG